MHFEFFIKKKKKEKKEKECVLHACVCVQEGNSPKSSSCGARNEIPVDRMLSGGQMALKVAWHTVKFQALPASWGRGQALSYSAVSSCFGASLG